jgi:hypothetical protein
MLTCGNLSGAACPLMGKDECPAQRGIREALESMRAVP